MLQNDRVAIHEVMEQQTVTIAKAGIHAALNARCSVIAAANPIYGQYDKSRRPQENIGLPDSLLSRFDLLFIVLDQMDPAFDKRLSEHVIRSHQYRRPGTIMEPEGLNASSHHVNLDELSYNGQPLDTPVWQRSSNSSSSNSDSQQGSAESDLLTKEFLRKYIHYSKSRIQPTLSEEAMERISGDYANMRAQQSRRNLPITARTLETMIRLSTAAAKSRLSQTVESVDVDVAAELLNFVLFHEIGTDTVMSNPVNRSQPSDDSSDSATSQASATSPEQLADEIENEEPLVTGGSNETPEDTLLRVCASLSEKFFDSFELDLLVSEFQRARPDIRSRDVVMGLINQLETSNKVCTRCPLKYIFCTLSHCLSRSLFLDHVI